MDITLQVVSSEECWNSGGITENMLCAKDEGQDTCQGDSGGPLVVKDNDEDVQVVVISFGLGCAMDEFAGVYARVSQAYEWIQKEVCMEVHMHLMRGLIGTRTNLLHTSKLLSGVVAFLNAHTN
jgi:secreted trypsin-like serine protease